MLYEFKVYQTNVEDHVFWVAESNTLKGCVGQGETSEEAIHELEENEKVWLDTAREYGIPIPSITCKKANHYSGKFSLRMSPFVHEKAADTARELGISLNQFINDAIVEYTASIRCASLVNVSSFSDTETNSQIIRFPAAKVSPYKTVREELEEM